MLVYTVIVGKDSSGYYALPAGIFSTYEKASKFCDTIIENRYDTIEIFEYEMDVPYSGFSS